MYKDWMSKNRLSHEYEVGVESFLQFALRNATNPNKIPCPCTRCGNLQKKNVDIIRAHLCFNGIDLTYHKWIWHGEGYTINNSMRDEQKSFAEEPIDKVHDAFDSYAENPNQFHKVLEDADKPLYPGCTKFTKLSALVKLYNLKARYSWSDKSFTDLLSLLGEMLPNENELPSSLWKLGKKATLNGVPAKVLWYFPPIPRFQRLFRNKEICKELTWHADKRVLDGYLRHPADAPAWKVVDHRWPDFAAEPRNLRLALSADEINPHSLMSSAYSCWPVVMITYNLPPWLCMKRKFMMLTLLISGPKQPGNDIDVYLAPLIDDLKKLWDIGNLSGCVVKGYCACPICGEEKYSTRLKHSRKISYTGHRRFLPTNHPYRRQKKAFNGKLELNPAPKPLTGHEILERVERINYCSGKASRKQTMQGEVVSCWKKKSIFFELEYWKHLHVRHVLDVMHIEKNVCESLIGTLLDIPGKSKDGVAARLELVEMNLRIDLAPKMGEKKTFLPAACYSSNVKNLVSMKDLKLVGLKSHDYHTLMQQLLPVAIRGVLPKHVRYTITRLCGFFNLLCNKVIDVSKLNDLQRDIVTLLCLLEKYFPPSFFDIMIHLTVHLVREVKLCGPVWYKQMYPFERFMKILKGYVQNHNRPEGCIAECYIAEEAVEFFSDYMSSHIFIVWLRDRVRAVGNSTFQISERLKWIARGPSNQVLKYSSYLIDGVTYHTKERNDTRAVQNSGVSLVAKTMQVASAKDKNPIVSDMTFYGVIQEIWELDYHNFQVPMFKCNWVENNNGIKVDELGFTLVNLNRIGFKSDSFILGRQAKQVFYIEDPQDPRWHVVLATPTRDYMENINGDELENATIHYQCSTKEFMSMESMDVDRVDENEQSCVREGTWVDNN
ncbi:uncharacterized protein [Henckelia pumila]|uniref:uncharacterized protein n=1 Tax=Henckelia pumila TaxID=405737 RepID=UPI003C6E99D3